MSVLVADCPWRFDDNLPGPARGASKHYRTMSADELCRLELPPIGKDAICFFWRVASMQRESLDVLHAWGFTPSSELIWVKTTSACGDQLGGYRWQEDLRTVRLPYATPAFGMGRTVRGAHETCIIATRGRYSKLVKSHAIRSVFFAPLGRHSEKPDEFYRIVEEMTEGPIVELFARRERGGRFTCIGDELGRELRVREVTS